MKIRNRVRLCSCITGVFLLLGSVGSAAAPAEPDAAVQPLTAISSIVIHGVSVPLANYPAGTSYFSDTGDPCTDHFNSNTCPANGVGCSCKAYSAPGFDTGIQCHGFAMYAYKQINCVDVSETREYDVGWIVANNQAFKDNMKSIPVGSMVRMNMRRSKAVKHGFILMRADDTHITAYHCNWDKQCGVSVISWTYEEFYQEFYQVLYYVAAENRHQPTGSVKKKTALYHYRDCSSCQKELSEQHTWRTSGTQRICTVCGQSVTVTSVGEEVAS